MIMLTTLPIKGSSGRVHVLFTSVASPQEDTGSNPMPMNSTQRILGQARLYDRHNKDGDCYLFSSYSDTHMLTTLPIKGSSGRVHVLITSIASPQEDTGSNPMLMNSTQRILGQARASYIGVSTNTSTSLYDRYNQDGHCYLFSSYSDGDYYTHGNNSDEKEYRRRWAANLRNRSNDQRLGHLSTVMRVLLISPCTAIHLLST